jgi:hypothetical protein
MQDVRPRPERGSSTVSVQCQQHRRGVVTAGIAADLEAVWCVKIGRPAPFAAGLRPPVRRRRSPAERKTPAHRYPWQLAANIKARPDVSAISDSTVVLRRAQR